MTHFDDEPCPLAADDNPIGMPGACCSLRGTIAARELDALGEGDLAARMYDDMPSDEAAKFAKDLHEAADTLERKYAGKARKPHGAGWNGTYDSKKKRYVWQTYTSFDDAIASIRQAARWYEKVGSRGFGVHAWY